MKSFPARRWTGRRASRSKRDFWHAIGMQLRQPSGQGGKVAGWLMRFINARPYSLALEALEARPDDTVLELGFGPGFGIARLAQLVSHGRVIGIDASEVMLGQALHRNRKAICRGRVRLVLGSFSRLPLPEESCDRILAVNVAYFFHPDGREIRESRRVLKSGGRLVLYVTDERSMRRWPLAGPESHRLLDAESLRDLVRCGGFARENIEVREAILPFGIRGLLAVVHK